MRSSFGFGCGNMLRLMAIAVAICTALPSTHAASVVPNDQAARAGLKVVWRAQVAVDAFRSEVVDWVLHRDRFFTLSKSGTVTALNAETGDQLWVSHAGRAGQAAAGMGTNGQVVAMVTGSQLYLMDIGDGHVLWDKAIGGASMRGPAVSSTHVFVALVSGRIEGHEIENRHATPWFYKGNGIVYCRPIVREGFLTWPNDLGTLFVGYAEEEPEVRFRLETGGEIISPPAVNNNRLYVGSMDGHLYRVGGSKGDLQWAVPVGYPTTSSPAAIGDQVFVASESPALHALGVDLGVEQWSVAGVSHFGAASETHVYGATDASRVVAIDRASGTVVGSFSAGMGSQVLSNDQCDSLFLVASDGLVQCLRERGSEEVTYYADSDSEAPSEEPEAVAPEEESPFEEEAAPVPESTSPFEEPASPFEEPAEESPSDDDNPFGAFNPFGD